MPDCSLGVLLRASGATQSGEQVSLTWKAWSRPSERALPSLGYADGKSWTLARAMSEEWVKWRAIFSNAGLDPGECCGRSMKAVTAKLLPDESLDDAEQEWWINTEALIVMMLHFACHKRVVQQRRSCELAAKIVLERCLPAAVVGNLPLKSPPGEFLELCEQMPRLQGGCPCLLEVLTPLAQSGARSVQASIVGRLQALQGHLRCPCVKAWFGALVKAVASSMEQSVGAWGDRHRQKTDAAAVQGPQKRRRTDPHLREWASSAAVKSGAAATTTMASRSTEVLDGSQAIRLQVKEMCGFLASLCLSFQQGGAISLAYDASKVGKPAREHLIGVTSCLRTARHAVLAPQAIIYE